MEKEPALKFNSYLKLLNFKGNYLESLEKIILDEGTTIPVKNLNGELLVHPNYANIIREHSTFLRVRLFEDQDFVQVLYPFRRVQTIVTDDMFKEKLAYSEPLEDKLILLEFYKAFQTLLSENIFFKKFNLVAYPIQDSLGNVTHLDVYRLVKGEAIKVFLISPILGMVNLQMQFSQELKAFVLKLEPAVPKLSKRKKT
jgi:hypothetical protein